MASIPKAWIIASALLFCRLAWADYRVPAIVNHDDLAAYEQLQKPLSRDEALSADWLRLQSDPQFPCRRPASFLLLKQWQSALELMPPCALYTLRPLAGYTQLLAEESRAIDLDPRKVLEVAFAYVSPGKKLSQRFGHALLKLTLCSPEEDPEWCRQSLDHQIAISYRGVTGLTKESAGKSQLLGLLIPWREILLEYSTKDQRQLEVMPLKISAEQKSLLILAFLEKQARETSSYQLVTNNCATALAALFNVVFAPRYKFTKLVSTPTNLREALLRKQLVTLRQGETTPSSKDEEETVIASIAPYIPSSVSRRILLLPAVERRQRWFALLSITAKQPLSQLSIAISVLENIALRKVEIGSVLTLRRILAEAEENSSATGVALSYRRASLALQFAQESYVELWRKGASRGFVYYGLLSEGEVKELEENLANSAARQKIKALSSEVSRLQHELLADNYREITEINTTIEKLFAPF